MVERAQDKGKDTAAHIIQHLIWKDRVEKGLEPLCNYQIDDMKSLGDRLSGWKVKKFAKKLKQRVELTFPYLFREVDWETKGDDYRNYFLESLGMTRRELLIAEGMKAREIHPEYWVIALFDEYRKESVKWDSEGNSTLEAFPNWIITDLRFPNELVGCDDLNSITVRMSRPGIPLIDSVSETALNGMEELFEEVVINDGSLDDLVAIFTELLTAQKIIG